MNPTKEFYGSLTQAYSHFNKYLFKNSLPPCLITAQREKNTMGYFSAKRWSNKDGRTAHEIALNPAYFSSHNLLEIFQTLVHEQCHLWQYEFGKPSRSGYHNRQWAEKMLAVGLTPSSTGKEGGKMTGQTMSDYPTPGGLFLKASHDLVDSGHLVRWIDRWPANRESSQVRELDNALDLTHELLGTKVSELMAMPPDQLALPVTQTRNKTKYTCAGCAISVWGKPDLHLLCMDCGLGLQAID